MTGFPIAPIQGSQTVDLAEFHMQFHRELILLVIMFWGLMPWSTFGLEQAGLPTALYPVGMVQVEYVDPADGGRPVDYMLIYPAAPDNAAAPFKIFLSTGLHLHKDAPIAPTDESIRSLCSRTAPAATARAMLGSVNTWRRAAIS